MSKELCRLCGVCMNVRSRLSKLTLRQIPFVLSQTRQYSQQVTDPFKRSFPKEEKPDYDLEGSGFINEGEVIFPEPQPKLTEVTEVSEPSVWKYVERLLPRTVVPEIPAHQSYPTPSGWVPPNENSLKLSYHVTRTKYHHLPIVLEIFDGASRKMTCIKKVDGDIWALEKSLRTHLEELSQGPIFTSVDEVCGKLRVRGNYMEEVSQFLLQQGF